MRVTHAIVMLLLCATALAQEHNVGVNKYVVPIYPPIARQARVQGDVVLKLKLRTDGEVDSIEAVSGHPMLKQAAINSLKQWRFVCIDCAFAQKFEQQTTVSFKIRAAEPCENDGDVRYELRFPGYVSVETGPVTICDPAPVLHRRSWFSRVFGRKQRVIYTE
jgi:TonB family protein